MATKTKAKKANTGKKMKDLRASKADKVKGGYAGVAID